MNKIIIILIVVVAGIGIVGFVSFQLFTARSGVNQDTTPDTSVGSQSPSTVVVQTPGTGVTAEDGATLNIEASDGGTLQITNIKKDPALVADSVNKGYYYLGYTVAATSTSSTVDTNPPYIIEYIDSTNYFNIALLKEPLGAVREEMQRYLQQHLGLTEEQMCRLRYMVGVPNWVNPYFASKSLRFSFCPGAEAL